MFYPLLLHRDAWWGRSAQTREGRTKKTMKAQLMMMAWGKSLGSHRAFSPGCWAGLWKEGGSRTYILHNEQGVSLGEKSQLRRRIIKYDMTPLPASLTCKKLWWLLLVLPLPKHSPVNLQTFSFTSSSQSLSVTASEKFIFGEDTLLCSLLSYYCCGWRGNQWAGFTSLNNCIVAYWGNNLVLIISKQASRILLMTKSTIMKETSDDASDLRYLSATFMPLCHHIYLERKHLKPNLNFK